MTGILDTFNRANAAGLGANWSEGDWLGDHFQIVANQCAHQGAQNQFGDAYWTAATYGPDSEVFLTVVEWPTPENDEVAIMARLSTPSATTMDGYLLAISRKAAGDSWRIARLDNNSQTNLGAAVTQNVADGDKIKLELVGSTIKGYRDSGSGWTEIISRSDSTHSGAGYLGFFAEQGTGNVTFDDFGGGTVVAGAGRIMSSLVDRGGLAGAGGLAGMGGGLAG